MSAVSRFRADPAHDFETERLGSLAARGDQQATRALISALLPRVRNVVRYLVRRDGDTDDAAQEALIAVLNGLPTYRGEGTIVSWVDRVTARTVFRYLERSRRQPDLSAVDLPSIPAVAAADEYFVRRRAAAVLDALPIEQRHAVVLHHVLEMTVPEIARELGISSETVRSRLRLARGRLREAGVEVDSEDRPRERRAQRAEETT
jgi:RNA polymerase sigma-70 factor (ECF subfamily)